MQTYRCPVCKKPLSQTEYERALGIIQEKDQHLARLQNEVKVERMRLDRERKEMKAQLKTATQNAVKQGMAFEKKRAERLMAGQQQQIQKLQERISQLEKGTTPQTDGLEFEGVLVERLRREFPTDRIEHHGKGCDILQVVLVGNDEVGRITYECKRSPRITESHIEQAYASKAKFDSDFTLLVTTGTRKGFSGFLATKEVIIVAPLGVVSVVQLLRAHVLEMHRLKISGDQRKSVGIILMEHLNSSQFKNPIEDTIKRSEKLRSSLKSEIKNHFDAWEQRWKHYQTIIWNTEQIRSDIHLVMTGKEPKPIAHDEEPNPAMLQIQARTKEPKRTVRPRADRDEATNQ